MSLATNSPTTFQLFLEGDNAHRTDAVLESVGFLAVNSGCEKTQSDGDGSDFGTFCPSQKKGVLSIDGVSWDYVVGVVESSAGKENVNTVSYGSTFKSTPILFASLQTSKGVHATSLRIKDANDVAFFFVVQDDNSTPSSSDTNSHPAEWVAWLAIGTFA